MAPSPRSFQLKCHFAKKTASGSLRVICKSSYLHSDCRTRPKSCTHWPSRSSPFWSTSLISAGETSSSTGIRKFIRDPTRQGEAPHADKGKLGRVGLGSCGVMSGLSFIKSIQHCTNCKGRRMIRMQMKALASTGINTLGRWSTQLELLLHQLFL